MPAKTRSGLLKVVDKIKTPLKTLTQAISPKNSPSSGCQNDTQTSSEHVNSNLQNAANTVLNASASSFVPGDISVLSAHDDSTADQSHSSSLPDEDLFTYCIQSCMYDRKDCGQPMTRCCLCMLWIHNNCSADTDEQIQASPIWYCSVCRQLPKMLTLELSTLRQNNSKLIDTVSLLHIIKCACSDFNTTLKSALNFIWIIYRIIINFTKIVTHVITYSGCLLADCSWT